MLLLGLEGIGNSGGGLRGRLNKLGLSKGVPVTVVVIPVAIPVVVPVIVISISVIVPVVPVWRGNPPTSAIVLLKGGLISFAFSNLT